MRETVETIWTLPNGKQVRTTNEVCPDCEHAHEAMLGGICVGCPCPNVPTTKGKE